MVLKNAVAAAVCTAVLALASPAVADQYRPDEFLGLDLSRAMLSPKPLGPPTEFAPVAVEAKSDGATESEQARAVPKAERKVVVRAPRLKRQTPSDRVSLRVQSLRSGTAIRSTRRRATRGSRHGRANQAASAPGNADTPSWPGQAQA